jgi:hypothetical protein
LLHFNTIHPNCVTSNQINLRDLSNYSVQTYQSTGNIANDKKCYQNRYNLDSVELKTECDRKFLGARLKPHQLTARVLMDYGKNVCLQDYGFLMFVSTRQFLRPNDRERYRQLVLEHSAIATSLICGLPLPVEVSHV